MPIPSQSASQTRFAVSIYNLNGKFRLCFIRLSEISSYGSKSLSPQTSPTRSSRGSKLGALDNLVISTIYNVSSKLCAASSSALSKPVAIVPDPDEEEVSHDKNLL